MGKSGRLHSSSEGAAYVNLECRTFGAGMYLSQFTHSLPFRLHYGLHKCRFFEAQSGSTHANEIISVVDKQQNRIYSYQANLQLFIMTIFTLSNLLSLSRIPLAFLLLVDNTVCRCVAIVLAMVSDCLDGYLARRNRTTSQLGAFLDPLGDKFFVIFAIFVFIQLGYLELWQAFAFVSRDIAVFIFGIYAVLKRTKERFHIQSFWCGKLSTTLQFVVLLAFTFGYHAPIYIYGAFILLGIFSLFELYTIEKKEIKSHV